MTLDELRQRLATSGTLPEEARVVDQLYATVAFLKEQGLEAEYLERHLVTMTHDLHKSVKGSASVPFEETTLRGAVVGAVWYLERQSHVDPRGFVAEASGQPRKKVARWALDAAKEEAVNGNYQVSVRLAATKMLGNLARTGTQINPESAVKSIFVI